MTNSIEIRGLCKRYEGFALQDITLTLPGGTIMGLIGENGAGKTTLLRCLLGLTTWEKGEIRLLGHADPQGRLQARQEIGFVQDECFFHDTLRTRDIGVILSSIYRDWDGPLFEAYLDKFSLPRKPVLKEYSRGMKMKLSLAAALAHHPKLLLLDEATSGLDPVVRSEILDEFQDFICDEEHAILLSSHITSDLDRVADYITYLHQGRVLLSDAKDEILDHYGRVACTTQELEALDSGDLLQVRRGSFGCEALVANRRDFQKKYPSLLVEPVNLEEIMLFIGKGEAICTGC